MRKQQEARELPRKQVPLIWILRGLLLFPPVFLLIYWAGASLLVGRMLDPGAPVALLFYTVLFLFPAGAFLMARWIAYSFVHDVAQQLGSQEGGGAAMEPFRVFRIEQEAGMLAQQEEQLKELLARELHDLDLMSGLWALGGSSHFHFPIASSLAETIHSRYRNKRSRAAGRQAGLVAIIVDDGDRVLRKAVENASKLIRQVSRIADRYGGFIYRGSGNCWEVVFSGSWSEGQTAVRTMKCAHELYTALTAKYALRVTADIAVGLEGLWRMPGYLRYFFESDRSSAALAPGGSFRPGLYLSQGLVTLVKEERAPGKKSRMSSEEAQNG